MRLKKTDLPIGGTNYCFECHTMTYINGIPNKDGSVAYVSDDRKHSLVLCKEHATYDYIDVLFHERVLR